MGNNTSKNHSKEEVFLPDIDETLEEESVVEEPRVSRARPSRIFNLEMRHKIEDFIEEKRLAAELNDYEYFNLDDDVLH